MDTSLDTKKEMKKHPWSTWLTICPFICIASVIALDAYAAKDSSNVSIKAGQSCATSECHNTKGKDKFVHGPVASGDCVFCHKQDKKDQHVFQPIKNVEALCYECHEKLNTGSVVHKPVAEGKCTGCHDPHQSATRFQLKGEGPALCFRCHDKTIAGGKFVHGPVAADGCSVCHSPHSSDSPKLLMAKGNDVCFSCHSDKKDEFADKKFAHGPVTDGCIQCHSPHSSNFKFNLPAESTQDLCFTCHTDKKDEIAKVTVKHGGLTTDKACLACHNPHVSSFPQQLDKAPMDLCLSCHDKEYKHADGTSVSNMKILLEKNGSHHGPILEKDCSACHNTHGSQSARILRGNFLQKFYAPYNPDNFKLCFMCHNDTLVKDAKTTTLTGFRNGDQNLHFVHVNKTPKGRTCKACHDAHATKNPKHITDKVAFGAYQMPVGFVKSKNGGACLPGCHQEFKYDRDEKVKNR